MDEIWKSIEGYEGIYEVSNLGRIKSLAREKYCGHPGSPPQLTKEYIKTTRPDRLGYTRVKLAKDGRSKTATLHRVIANAFVKNPENKKEVNHIDGDKSNNSIGNLEWCTKSENALHAFENNLRSAKKGEENNKSKLTWEQVREIRDIYSTGNYTMTKIAGLFDVSIANISEIINKKTWKEVN